MIDSQRFSPDARCAVPHVSVSAAVPGRALQAILTLNPEAKVLPSSGYSGHDAIQHSQEEGLVKKYVKPK